MEKKTFKTKVSVIIPVYNAEKYLKDTVNSILQGTFSDFEVLLVDDGSSDSSLEVMKELEQQDSRVRALQIEHGGVGKARNFGIDQAKGEMLAFVDSDDTVKPSFLSRMVAEMDAHNLDWVYCASIVRYVDGTEEIRSLMNEDTFVEVKEGQDTLIGWVFNLRFNYGLMNMCFGLFRKEIIDKYHIRVQEDVKIGEDLLFNYCYAQNVRRFKYVVEPLYIYEKREQSAMGQYDKYEKSFEDYFNELEHIENLRLERNWPIVVQAKSHIHEKLMRHIFNMILANKDVVSKNQNKKDFHRLLHSDLNVSKLYLQKEFTNGLPITEQIPVYLIRHEQYYLLQKWFDLYALKEKVLKVLGKK